MPFTGNIIEKTSMLFFEFFTTKPKYTFLC